MCSLKTQQPSILEQTITNDLGIAVASHLQNPRQGSREACCKMTQVPRFFLLVSWGLLLCPLHLADQGAEKGGKAGREQQISQQILGAKMEVGYVTFAHSPSARMGSWPAHIGGSWGTLSSCFQEEREMTWRARSPLCALCLPYCPWVSTDNLGDILIIFVILSGALTILCLFNSKI